MSKNLLINMHCPSANTRRLRDALVEGATQQAGDQLSVRVTEPLQTTVDDVLWADGIILGTTENFGYMSGAMKDFFDRIYYPCLEQKQGMPCAIVIRAGLDGTGTEIAISKILSGLKWRQVQEALIAKGDFDEKFLGEWRELSGVFAAGLEAGIF